MLMRDHFPLTFTLHDLVESRCVCVVTRINWKKVFYRWLSPFRIYLVHFYPIHRFNPDSRTVALNLAPLPYSLSSISCFRCFLFRLHLRGSRCDRIEILLPYAMCTMTSIHTFLWEFNLNRRLKVIEQCTSVVILANSYNSDSGWGSWRTTYTFMARSRSAQANGNQWSFYCIDTARKWIEFVYPRIPLSFTIVLIFATFRGFGNAWTADVADEYLIHTDFWHRFNAFSTFLQFLIWISSNQRISKAMIMNSLSSLLLSPSLSPPVSLSLSRLMHSTSL